jgi:hypothetical protein
MKTLPLQQFGNGLRFETAATPDAVIYYEGLKCDAGQNIMLWVWLTSSRREFLEARTEERKSHRINTPADGQTLEKFSENSRQ